MSHVTVENTSPSDDPSEPVESPETTESEQIAESHPGEQEEMSPYGSIYLHLLSEHEHYDGLLLDETDASVLHEQLHHLAAHASSHPEQDLRFRPLVALDNALYSGNKRPDPQPEVLSEVPVQASPGHDDLPEHEEVEPAAEDPASDEPVETSDDSDSDEPTDTPAHDPGQ